MRSHGSSWRPCSTGWRGRAAGWWTCRHARCSRCGHWGGGSTGLPQVCPSARTHSSYVRGGKPGAAGVSVCQDSQ